MIKPQVNFYYQHRYGGIYMVQDIATSTVDQSQWVVYVHVYPFEYQTWVRPYDEWCDGRFRKLEEGEYDNLLRSNREEFQKAITANKDLRR